MSKAGWVNAYTKRRVRGFFPTYDIIFEERPLFQVSGCGFANELVAALNGAYNLGRGSMEAQMCLEVIKRSGQCETNQDKEKSQTSPT